MPIGQKVRSQVVDLINYQTSILLRNIQASATMNKHDTLYTGLDPRTIIYRTVYHWEDTSLV